jgi:hypothetical protein
MTRTGVALAVGIALLAPCFADETKTPTIVFQGQSKDFGKTTEGELLKHVFSFTNKGTGALEILNVEAACGCTSTLLSAKRIAPGQTGQIEAAVKTEGNSGRIEKSITVSTNDPRQPQIVLKLVATVEPEFNVSERSIYFGSVPKGKEVVREVEVRIPPEKAVKVLSAESTDAAVTVRLEPVGSGGKTYKVIATQKADAAEGYHFGNIVLKTTSSYTRQLRIPVRGMVNKAAAN